jgi:hypothetical protein
VTGIDIIRKQLLLGHLLSLEQGGQHVESKISIRLAVLVPLLGAAIPAEAAKAAKSNSTAARAECFRQANEAVAAQGVGANIGDKNAMGQDAYRQCCFKAGIRP